MFAVVNVVEMPGERVETRRVVLPAGEWTRLPQDTDAAIVSGMHVSYLQPADSVPDYTVTAAGAEIIPYERAEAWWTPRENGWELRDLVVGGWRDHNQNQVCIRPPVPAVFLYKHSVFVDE